MAYVIFEALWLKTLLHEIGFEEQTPMSLYCDNKLAINISHNSIQHDLTKHVEVNQHFIRENILCGLICTLFVTMDQ